MPASPADLIPPVSGERLQPQGVAVTVARDVADAADPIYVLVQDGTTGRVVEEGPMYWPPSEPLPAEGDAALMIVDDSGSPWVAAWWGARSVAPPIRAGLIDAEGDLIVGAAADTPARLAVGADGKVLTASSSAPDGIAWANAAAALAGTRTGRPAAGDVAAGATYYATDNGITYRSDGATWTAIGWQALRVTSLPTSPTPEDGQRIDYVGDSDNGVLFPFRYNADSASIYKWEAVGVSALYAEVTHPTAEATTAATTYADLSPNLTPPLAGVYDARLVISAANDVAATTMLAGLRFNATDPNDFEWIEASFSGTGRASHSRTRRITVATASTVVQPRWRITTANTWRSRQRELHLTPVRVG